LFIVLATVAASLAVGLSSMAPADSEVTLNDIAAVACSIDSIAEPPLRRRGSTDALAW
jgi:hypothetical protein